MGLTRFHPYFGHTSARIYSKLSKTNEGTDQADWRPDEASCATTRLAVAQLYRLRVAQPGSNNVAFSAQVALSRGQLRYHTAGGSTTSPQITVPEVGNIGKLKATGALWSTL